MAGDPFKIPELRRFVEFEARIRSREAVVAGDGGGGARYVERVPAITTAGIGRVVQYLKAHGFTTDGSTEVYTVVDISAAAPMPEERAGARSRLRVRLNDTLHDATFQKYFQEGCVIDPSAWETRHIKCTYEQEDDADLPVRISTSLEVPVHQNTALLNKQFRLAAPTWGYLAQLTWEEVCDVRSRQRTQYLRWIKRRSFEGTRDDISIRVDISIVRACTPASADSKNPPGLSWELEVEYKVPHTAGGPGTATTATTARPEKDEVAALLRDLCKQMVVCLNDEPYMELKDGPVVPSRRDTANALAAFHDLRRRHLQKKRGSPQAYVSVPKPVPAASIVDLCGTARWTPKADGVPAYCLVWRDGETPKAHILTDDAPGTQAFIVRTFQHGLTDEQVAGTLLSGEYARTHLRTATAAAVEAGGAATPTSAPGRVFLVFDALVVCGRAVYADPFEQRLAAAKKVVDKLRWDERPPVVVLKEFHKVPAASSGSGSSGSAQRMLEYQEDVPVGGTGDRRYYKSDGLILMGDGPLFVPRRTAPVVRKWKPAKEQTVDLLVHFDQYSSKFLYMCGKAAKCDGYRVYTFHPFEYHKIRLPVCRRQDEAVDRAASCPVIEGGNVKLGDGMVVEFRVVLLSEDSAGGSSDTARAKLVPVRLREDKTAQHRRAMAAVRRAMDGERHDERARRCRMAQALCRNYSLPKKSRVPLEWVGLRARGRSYNFPRVGGNQYDQACQTVDLALDPLTLSTVNAGWETWAGGYFKRREPTPPSLRAMITRNSRGKEGLIAAVFSLGGNRPTRVNVLDLGCGEGNDIPRWRYWEARLRNYVGIDKDTCAVMEARRRLKLRANASGFARKATFLQGEMGGKVVDGKSTVPKKYGIISIFFAVHYAPDINQLMRYLANKLDPDGRIIITFMDSDRIYELMDKAEEGGEPDATTTTRVLKHDGHYSISEVGRGEEGAGAARWLVKIAGLGDAIEERQISQSVLRGAAESAGLAVEWVGPLEHAIAKHRAVSGSMEEEERRLGGAYFGLVLKRKHSPTSIQGLPALQQTGRPDTTTTTSPMINIDVAPSTPDDYVPRSPYEPPPQTPPNKAPATPEYEPTTPEYLPTTPEYEPTTPEYLPTTPEYEPPMSPL